MAAGATKYTPEMAIRIGASSKIELPARVFCGRLTGFLFDTSKCFLLPGAVTGLREICRFYDDHPGLDVLISGHADRAGAADANLVLSTERADAVEAFLRGEVARWTPWYDASKPAHKRWGTGEDQHMLAHLGHYAGPITGRNQTGTADAIVAFRTAEGLGAGGADGAMRHKLVERYMRSSAASLPADTLVVHHGCGEFHPSKATADGMAAAENRRVEVYFFEGPITPAPPPTCPAGGCDAYSAWGKRVVETIDLSVGRDLVPFVVALRDRASSLIARAPYRMQAGDRRKVGRASDGLATLHVPVTADRCVVEWGREADPDVTDDSTPTAFRVELYLHYDLGSDDEQARMRLHNLGYLDTEPLEHTLRAFQQDHELSDTGVLDAETQHRLTDIHDRLATPAAEPAHG